MNPLAHYDAFTCTIIGSINTHFVWVDMHYVIRALFREDHESLVFSRRTQALYCPANSFGAISFASLYLFLVCTRCHSCLLTNMLSSTHDCTGAALDNDAYARLRAEMTQMNIRAAQETDAKLAQMRAASAGVNMCASGVHFSMSPCPIAHPFVDERGDDICLS